MSSKTTSEGGEVVTMRSSDIERSTTWTTEVEFSALVGCKTEVVKNVTVSAEDLNDKLIS